MAKSARSDGSAAGSGRGEASLPMIDGYEFLEPIGRGGMGEVFVARQVALDRLVAIKLLNNDERSCPDDGLTRFHREAALMAKVSHPNVLSIYDFGEVDGRPYLVMEYVARGDLRRKMKPGQPMSIEWVRSIVTPVGEALAHLHRTGILHRDLKPENILLHDDNNPRVSDFGIAVLRTGDGGLTQTGQVIGTLGYIAPEQQYRLKVDDRADQFSLAALAYEMLTGQLPLGVFKPPSALNARLSPEVDAVLLRGLQENPRARFKTVREFTAALSHSLDGASPKRVNSRQVVLAALLLLVVGLAVALPLTGRQPEPAKPLAPEAPPPANTLNPLEEAIKSVYAREIWADRGKPAGEKAGGEIWYEAAGRVHKELEERAYKVWVERGAPEGAAGRAMQNENWDIAVRRLYKEMIGEPPPEPGAPEKGTDPSPGPPSR